VYLPYEVVSAGSPSGAEVRKGKPALRNDNPHKRWIADGGI
jgi:hypothetical protein